MMKTLLGLVTMFILMISGQEMDFKEGEKIDLLRCFTDIAYCEAGENYLLFLKENGDLYRLGKGVWEEPYEDEYIDPYDLKLVMKNVVDFSCGYNHLLLITEDRTLYGVGSNELYQLGTGNFFFQKEPVEIISDVASCYAGEAYSLVLKENGELYGFGNNLYHQIANSSVVEFKMPKLLASGQSEIIPGQSITISDQSPGEERELVDRLEEEIVSHRVEEDSKLIAFTFDDGPSAHTNALLDELQRYGARASFFVLGTNASRHQWTMQRIVNEGHEIGNHSYSHPQLTKLSDQDVLFQVDSCDDIIKEATGLQSVLFRPPYGSYDSRVLSLLESRGKSVIMWNVDTLDWKYRDSAYVRDYILNHARDGNIVLLHDVHKTTVEGFIAALPELNHRGFKMITVSELMELRKKELLPGAVYFDARN